MSDRKLVTYRFIKDVITHPNADALDLVLVDGWQCVAKRGEFKPGDACFYIEIDAILPDGNPAWQFLVDKQSKNYENGKGHRLRTIKLRGEYSQGLVLPVEALPNVIIMDIESEDGMADLDSQLGVYKYEPPAAGGPGYIAGNARGAWPNWFPKTDQERVENCFDKVAASGVEEWVVEEKLEGSSVTIYTDNGDLGVCSRNVDLKLDESNADNVFIKTVFRMGLDVIANLEGRWAIRGELIGPNIQGNIYKLEETIIYIFDVWNGDEQRYLTPDERATFLAGIRLASGAVQKDLVVNEVPRLGRFKLPSTVADVVAMADGESKLFPTKREGLVFKSVGVAKFGLQTQVISFKSISRDYLASEK